MCLRPTIRKPSFRRLTDIYLDILLRCIRKESLKDLLSGKGCLLERHHHFCRSLLGRRTCRGWFASSILLNAIFEIVSLVVMGRSWSSTMNEKGSNNWIAPILQERSDGFPKSWVMVPATIFCRSMRRGRNDFWR